MKSQERKKVYVGLSGGVDSAVSVALLKKEGYKVTGVFIKAWTPEGYPCAWKEDRRSAMKVAAILDIPFITLDLEKEYKKEVADYMIGEYKKGKTPNPDVMCNKEIKFGHFLNFALKDRADFVATGHYCQREKLLLKEGEDKNKDQSYFLWALTQKQLKHILFPIGRLQKNEVRKLAEKFNLPQAIRKDSQGLCFLGQVEIKDFLRKYLKVKKGQVLDEENRVIGEHDGALLYTIGERHGFRVWRKDSERKPMYVVAKDIRANTITVASMARKKLLLKKSSNSLAPVLCHSTQNSARPDFPISNLISGKKEIKIEQMNWLNKSSKVEIKCRLRYRQEKTSCKVRGSRVVFKEPQNGISPGQSIVFYHGEICLGGAIISS